MYEDVLNTLKKFITKEILKQPDRFLDPNEALLTNGLIDSFHLVDLGIFIEDQFGVRIDDSELNASTFDSLHQLVTLIESRRG